MNQYNNLTLQEFTSFLSGDYGMNIDIFDSLYSLIDIMGNYYAEGLYNFLTYRNQQTAE